MASTKEHVVLLKVNGGERPIFEMEAAASTAIKPGMLIYESAAGKVSPIASTNAPLRVWVAVEHPYQYVEDDMSAAPTSPVDKTYAAGDTVYFIKPQRGDLVRLRYETAANATLGAFLAGYGATEVGFVHAVTPDASTVTQALFAVVAAALTGVSGQVGWLKAEIL